MSDRSKTNAYFRSYYQKNKDRIKAIQKKYYESNKGRLTIQNRDRYRNDTDYRQKKLLKMAEYRNRKRIPV
jgi:hypothetical protein